MKRDFAPAYLAAILFLVCVIVRLAGSHFAEFLPNVSPLMALAYVGAMYFPRRWGWLLGPAALLVTDLAFLGIDARTNGSGQLFTAWTVVGFLFYAAVYAAASGFGIWIARNKSLAKILAGSVLCSTVFYVAANTFSWLYDCLFANLPDSYPATFAGWVQANTTGLPGYDPTWLFLRNGIAGDLFFTVILLLVLDRALLFGPAHAKTAPRLA